MDKLFEWFETASLGLKNYLWILCALLLVVIALVLICVPMLVAKSKKIKTLTHVLNEEQSCKCGKKESEAVCECAEHKDDEERMRLFSENEKLSSDVVELSDSVKESEKRVELLTEECEELKKRIVELEEDVEVKEAKLLDLEKELKNTRTECDMFKAKHIENNAELASYKTTNDILSKSIDNLKVQIADKNDEIIKLKSELAKLDGVEKKAMEAAEDNKVLMRAVSLIMNTKDDTAVTTGPVILNEKEIPVAEKPAKKVAKPATKKTAKKTKAAPVSDDLESMKRHDLMHLAKAEGVKRFARKSNVEIIRLIRENRKSKE